MVPTTKELSCSNWPPPVRIQLCCRVTMETIVMSQAMASLNVAGRQLLILPLTPSTPVINSWEEKAEQLNRFQERYRAFK